MSARDDELTQRYREANAQDDPRPGAHVRSAVRAHAQMMAAAAAAASPAPAAPGPAAANQSHWKISALATVAVVGLTGLLLLQFQRGTPEEQEIAYGPRSAAPAAKMQAPAAPSAPAAAPQAPPAPPPEAAAPAPLQDSAQGGAGAPPRSSAQKPAAPAPVPARPLAKAAPQHSIQEAEALPVPGRVGAVSGFPASPPFSDESSSGAVAGPPAAAPSPPSAPRAEMRERQAVQDAPAARSMAPPPHAAAPSAAADASRSLLPEPARPAPQAAGSLRRDGAADNRLAAAAPRADSGRSSVSLPDGLREAARTGRVPEVESLVSQGVPIDSRDSAGKTALMLAAASGQSATVQKLLALGANPALRDHEGLNAAQQARRGGHERIAEQIEAGP